ncbi:hypothetical protein FSARC_12348 [Fusarium sarcochroum]|uniref:GST N-terminal domain-containing protein n=1 Tax=Fusarium sarcochroum TaxID=1208366 RepID=A0A8H4T989_9HYPO|nr:hypothetical protein FSARC_12348 [Fusarium sarcochroum]
MMAAGRSAITLYDIPSIARKSWSPNAWKARLILNFKALPYSTEWLELPEISTKMQVHNLVPNAAPTSPYTIPCILLLEGEGTKGVMGSRAIARALEDRFSMPSLHLGTKGTLRIEELAEKLLIASRPLWAYLLPERILTQSSAQYYTDTRTKRFGMNLELYCATHVSQQLWNELDDICGDIGDSLAKSSGPFLRGHAPSYGDFSIVAVLRFFNSADPAMFDHFCTVEPQLRKLYKACDQWLERDY